MHAAEPVSMLTDYALAAASLVFAVLVRRSIGPRNRVSAWFWCAAFIAAAIAAAAGGTFHALDRAGSARWALWNLTVFSMGACGAFITGGIHSAFVERKDGTVLWLACGIAVTLLGAAVQRARLPGVPLGHNDAYHLIQIGGLYCFFRCARTVHDRPGIPRELPGEARPAADHSGDDALPTTSA